MGHRESFLGSIIYFPDNVVPRLYAGSADIVSGHCIGSMYIGSKQVLPR